MAHAKSTDPNVFILPDLGEGVHEAEMISWKVKPGDAVKEHQVIAEMETDKALVEVPSPRDGVIKTLHGKEGEILYVGKPLVTYEAGIEALGHQGIKESPKPAAAADEDAGTVVGSMGGELAGVSRTNGKALAAPAVRRIARDLGVDINLVPGTGIAGRVTAKDVKDFAEGKTSERAASVSERSAPPARPPSAPSAAPAPRVPTWPASHGSNAGAGTAPPPTRMPMPAQPAYAPAAYTQPAPQPVPYPAQMPMHAPTGVPMPMPVFAMTPWGLMPMPMMMPGYGMMPGAAQAAGVPQAPGFTPFQSGRPVPDPAQQAQPGSRVPFRGVRRTIAQRLRDSVNTAVHFTVVDEADATELDALRREISAQSGQKLSFLPFVAVAVCRALSTRFGALNATVDDDAQEIVQHAAVHLGIATDSDSGLMVPVIPGASSMDVVTLGAAIADTAKAARARTLPRERLIGSTFTISNVGSHAGRFATPVINYPEVAILAVGKAYDGVVVRDGQAVVGKVLPLSLACDHRVVDGATAALCLAEIVGMIQEPGRLL